MSRRKEIVEIQTRGTGIGCENRNNIQDKTKSDQHLNWFENWKITPGKAE